MEFLIVLFAFVVYFVPTWVAGKRNHRNGEAIFVLNLFLGWTFVFWVLSLVWALINEADKCNCAGGKSGEYGGAEDKNEARFLPSSPSQTVDLKT